MGATGLENVLHCPVVKIGVRSYRSHAPLVQATHARPPKRPEPEHAARKEMIVDESLLEQQGDTWLARVSCDQELFGFVIGRGGQTKKRVEKETGSSLKIPDRHTEGAGEITITAPDAESAARGRAEVQELVNGAVASSRTDYNAFISLPLRTPAGEDSSSYNVLWSSLLADPEVAGLGVAEEMMTSPSTLHLTLGMLKLYSAELRERARKVLKQVQGEVLEMLDGQSLRVMLSGMRSMNGDLERTHVLYLQVKDMGTPGQVQQIADYVAQAFHAAGLVADGGSVKLHATVINSRYRKTVPAEPGAPRRRRPERVAFDARRIVDKYGALEVGPLLLSELHISQRRRFDEDGYYHCLGRADL